MTERSVPDPEAFRQVCAELAAGDCLTFRMLGRIFGHGFWELKAAHVEALKLAYSTGFHDGYLATANVDQ